MHESVKILDLVKGGRLNLAGAIYDMNIQRAPNIYAIDCYSEGMILDVSRLVQEAHKTIIGAITIQNQKTSVE